MNDYKLRDTVIAAIVFIVLFLFGLLCSHVGEPPNEYPWDWEFAVWQIIWTLLFSLNGAVSVFFIKDAEDVSKKERFNDSFFLKNLIILAGILIIISGAKTIQNEEVFTKLSSIEGKGAIFIGALKVLFGAVLFGFVLIMSLYAWLIRNK